MVVLCGVPGCGLPGYVLHAGWAEARLLWQREPIESVLARTDVDANLRRRLELVGEVREFAAARLGLAVGENYTSFVSESPEATVHVVSAARRDRLEAYSWWYPLVGRLPYRGFFRRVEAEVAADRLTARGLDVEIRPALAFSTLGWFADPVVAEMTARPPVELVDTLLHELFHATRYLPGAARFNESAATFVGGRGAVAFFCAAHVDTELCAAARQRWAMIRQRGRLWERLAARLERLFARHLPVAAREAARTWYAGAAATELERRRIGARAELLPPNNARFLGHLLYLTALDRFDALAPTDDALAGAIRHLIESTPLAHDPFEVLPGGIAPKLQTSAPGVECSPCRPSALPRMPCSGDWPAGCVSWATTPPTARISAGMCS